MIDFINVRLGQVFIHQVGNKLRDEGLTISGGNVEFENSETANYLLKYFLTPFTNTEVYNLCHPSELDLNEIYFYVAKIFASPEYIYAASIEIAKHLYEKSTHPKVNAGELCICYFKNCVFDGTTCDAIGFFKSEGKDVFLKFMPGKFNFSVNHDSGININKLDKGCLIFNLDKSKGFNVCIIDTNVSKDTQYWKNDFLNIRPAADDYHLTKDFLSITKNFITKQLSQDFEVSRTDQIDLLNRSVEYFKSHDNFDKDEFEKDVFREARMIESFQNFDNTYRQDHELKMAEDFNISPQAVKKQVKVFKKVLKLDKNFDIHIYGDRELIEKGVERDGRKFYKIYYNIES